MMKLTVNLVKCEFCRGTVDFLGYTVGQGQVRPLQAKAEVISDYPTSKNRKDLMRFLGMAGYYRRFCKNFSIIAQPLTALLKKKVKFVWSEDCNDAFNKIKAILNCSPVLIAPDFEKQFDLYVDASDMGAGAVLMQTGSDNVEHPLCYFSKKFDKHQLNCATIEKECLALMLALNHFNVYLCVTRHPIVVHTDNNPLTFINKMKNKNQRVLRWSLSLQEYDLEIRHIRGKESILADALSRVNRFHLLLILKKSLYANFFLHGGVC